MDTLMKKEVLFVKFPILFPIIYFAILYTFPNFETQLVFITILLLAETHFGATWPFFLSKVNFPHINKNKVAFIVIPILVTVFCITGFFVAKNTFLLIFFAANVFHVTRQSFGITNLYTKDENQKKHFVNVIYFFNFIFFVIAFFRFYIPIISNNMLFELNLIMILLLILVFAFYIIRFKFSENLLTMITGVLIFYPVCFVNNPVHAIIMGVTMHYSQYLILTYKITKNRNLVHKDSKSNLNFIIIIISYGIIMSLLSSSALINEIFKNLLLIPLIGQMLHFYIDSNLWKFSDKHHRNVTLKHLLS